MTDSKDFKTKCTQNYLIIVVLG